MKCNGNNNKFRNEKPCDLYFDLSEMRIYVCFSSSLHILKNRLVWSLRLRRVLCTLCAHHHFPYVPIRIGGAHLLAFLRFIILFHFILFHALAERDDTTLGLEHFNGSVLLHRTVHRSADACARSMEKLCAAGTGCTGYAEHSRQCTRAPLVCR